MSNIVTKLNPFTSILKTIKNRNCNFCNIILIPSKDEVYTITRYNLTTKKQLANHYLCTKCGTNPDVVLSYYEEECTTNIPTNNIIKEIPQPIFINETIEPVSISTLPEETITKQTSFFKKILRYFGL